MDANDFKLMLVEEISNCDALLFFHAWKYFSAEQADGTPFSHSGADRVLHLGILNIVLPLVAAILSALVCELLTLPQDAVRDWGNLNSLTMGIVLILASLIFRYGAELETQKQEESSCYE